MSGKKGGRDDERKAIAEGLQEAEMSTGDLAFGEMPNSNTALVHNQEQEKAKSYVEHVRHMLIKTPVAIAPEVPIMVFDTSYLLHDPCSIDHNSDKPSVRIIPFVVLEELDKHKGNPRTGTNAREVLRRIYEHTREHGTPTPGVYSYKKVYLVFAIRDSDNDKLVRIFDQSLNDNEILSIAIQYKNFYPGNDVSLLSKDINLLIKAGIFGLKISEFSDFILEEKQTERYSEEEFYRRITLSPKNWSDLAEKKVIPLRDIKTETIYLPNEALRTFNSNTGKDECLVVNHLAKEICLIGDKKQRLATNKPACAIHEKNWEQLLAMAQLLDPQIKLIFLIGKAGTGKTLLALAMGLLQVKIPESEEKNGKRAKDRDNGASLYQRVNVARPIVSFGEGTGWLPGDIKDKMRPWMQPITDNLEILRPNDYQTLMNNDVIQVESLSYIRGRSLPNQYMIVDEAQNLTPHEIQTIITRAGNNTKIIFTGDPWQIDNQYVDFLSNGLTVWSEMSRGCAFATTLYLSQGERSELADWASKVMIRRR